MRIILTGATGILGRHLMRIARASNTDIVGTSRSTEGDGIARVSDYRDIPEGEVLVHLAQPALRGGVSQEDEQEAVKLFGTIADRRWEQIVYISSATVYASQNETLSESAPVQAVDPYTALKLGCEQICKAHGGTVIRLSNILSDPPAASTVCSDILGQIPGEGPLLVRDAAAHVDLVWVEDAVAGILGSIQKRSAGVFNIASGQSLKVGDIARRALAAAAEANRRVESLAPSSSSHQFGVDVSKAAYILDWHPQTDPLEVVAKLVNRKTLQSDDRKA